MRNTALHPTTYALGNSSWPLLLWVLGERVSWLHVLCFYYEVQAVIVYKGACKNNWVEWLTVSYCPKVTCATVSVHCTPSVYWYIWWTVWRWNSTSLQKKKSFFSLCTFLFIQNGRGASSLQLQPEEIHHIHCLRWRMLSCIPPLLPVQTICFRESWGQIFCCTYFPFMLSGLLHPFPYSVCLIPSFTHNMKLQQSCICHVSLLPVGPLKSAGFPLV